MQFPINTYTGTVDRYGLLAVLMVFRRLYMAYSFAVRGRTPGAGRIPLDHPVKAIAFVGVVHIGGHQELDLSRRYQIAFVLVFRTRPVRTRDERHLSLAY